MPALKQILRKYALLYTALILGALAIGSALWELGHTAYFVHKAVVLPGTVTDVRQRPFESQTEAWTHGNLCWPAETAYQPYVSFTLPAGITINKFMPDLDCRDYTLHQNIEIITHPHDPNQAHIYQAKFLCGWSLMKAVAGVLLFLPAWLILRKRRRHRTPAKKEAKHSAAAPHPRATKTTRKKSQTQAEDDFALVAPEPAPAKKRRTRKQSGADSTAKKAPAKRKKSTNSASGAKRG